MTVTFVRGALVQARWQQARREALQTAQVGIDVLAREIRMAGFSGTGQPLPRIAAASDDAIEVIADLNADGDVNDAHERILYRFDASRRAIMRGSGGGSPQPFVRNVAGNGFRLHYADAEGQPILPGAGGLPAALRARVASVEVRLQVNVESGNRGQAVSVPASALIALRNP